MGAGIGRLHAPSEVVLSSYGGEVAVPDDADRLVELFCERRIPPNEDMRLEVRARGSDLTIVERRRPWGHDPESEWSSSPVAKLHWDEKAELWSLRCADANGKWHRYDELPPSADLGTQLIEIDRDPTGIFWG